MSAEIEYCKDYIIFFLCDKYIFLNLFPMLLAMLLTND